MEETEPLPLESEELDHQIQADRVDVAFRSALFPPFSPFDGVGPEALPDRLLAREEFRGATARTILSSSSKRRGQQGDLEPISVLSLDIFVNFIRWHGLSCHNCPCEHNLDSNFDLWTSQQPPWADRYLLDNFTMVDSEMAGKLEPGGPKLKPLPFMGIILFQMVEPGRHMVWGTIDASAFVPKDHAQRQHFVIWLHAAQIRPLNKGPKRRVQQELD